MDDAVEALLTGTSFYEALPDETIGRVCGSLIVENLRGGEAVCKRGSSRTDGSEWPREPSRSRTRGSMAASPR